MRACIAIRLVPLVATAILLAGCGSGVSAPKSTTSTTGRAVTTTTTAASNVAAVGEYFTYTNGLNVQLVKVIDPAAASNQFEAAPKGQRLVAVEFAIWSSKGSQSDDIDLAATIQGSNFQTYQPTFSNVTECTNFDSGTFNVRAGSPREDGCAVFQIPDRVRVAEVVYTPTGFDTSPSTWKVVSGSHESRRLDIARRRLLKVEGPIDRALNAYTNRLGRCKNFSTLQRITHCLETANKPFLKAVNQYRRGLGRIKWPTSLRVAAERVETDNTIFTLLFQNFASDAQQGSTTTWLDSLEFDLDIATKAVNVLRMKLGLPRASEL